LYGVGGPVPSGVYAGSTSVLGQTLAMTITVVDASTGSIVVSGAVSVSCPNESYNYANGVITLPNSGNNGDCVHDSLAKTGATISSITFSPDSNIIISQIKYSFLTISIRLKHQDVAPLVPRQQANQMMIGELFAKYFVAFSLNDPSGAYKGTKTILGEQVTAVITVHDNNGTFDFALSGPVSINCLVEPYTYANGVISVTDINQPGDCVHQALSDNNATLKSITYDTSANTITVSIKYSFLDISLVCDHQ